jgi:RNA recognition motif-containing protein
VKHIKDMARRGGKNKTGRKPGKGPSQKTAAAATQTNQDDEQHRHQNPLIVFVGQLSFDTTREDLLDHIKSQLAESQHKVSDKTLRIRMLTNKKTKQSRGMAFVEILTGDPEFLFALLKLHQTYLKGRRINVERSAGGGKNSETRKTKLEQYKKEQQEYFAEVVDNILKEFKATGEIRDNELDGGVIQLCRRHAGPVVRAAITEYVEKGGRDMDNPSAYLTFLVAKFAKEGIHDEEATGKTKTNKKEGASYRKRKVGEDGDSSNSKSKRSKEWRDTSSLKQSGVDMPLSDKRESAPISSMKDLSRIFPSSTRGKGRGYMKNVRSS